MLETPSEILRCSLATPDMISGPFDNNYFGDPGFVNPAGGNFNLRPDSPALTAGSGGTQPGACAMTK
jgi:hypothetical protein